jgi:superfamily II DNA or RNA helicase
MAVRLRTHQRQIVAVAQAIAAGQADGVRDILAAVTPGGGKSLLPIAAASLLVQAGVVDRVCVVVPRDSLRRQAEEAFADQRWRAHLGHNLSIRSAENGPDLCRGTQGYVTTYQAVAAQPDLHLAEFRRHRYLCVIDEVHHLPALADAEPSGMPRALRGDGDEACWSRAILPLLELARVRLLLSGTLERADGRAIIWLPYRPGRHGREVDVNAPGWAVIGYSRADALSERAILPLTFGALDGQAEWLDWRRERVGPHRLSTGLDSARPALFTALRTGFADALLDEAFDATRALRAERRRLLGVAPGEVAAGLGKLLVVAPTQGLARKYLDRIRSRLPRIHRDAEACLAVSDSPGAHDALVRFRLQPTPAILVTVAMAYEGLDVPEIAVVAALTHIRSQPWLEQMAARATRYDPRAGAYESQRALIFHPDDPLFRRFRERMVEEQSRSVSARRPERREGGLLALDVQPTTPALIIPLSSNATTLRFEELAAHGRSCVGPSEGAGAQGEMLATASEVERQLRQRIGQLVSAQVVEEEGEMRLRRGGNYHRFNAILRKVRGKARGEMTVAELQSTVSWLEQNRLVDFLDILRDDVGYEITARRREQRKTPHAGGWPPPASRQASHGLRTGSRGAPP